MNYEAEKKLIEKFLEEYTYVNNKGIITNYSSSLKKEIRNQFNKYMHGPAHDGKFKSMEEFFVDIDAVENSFSMLKGHKGNDLADDSRRKRYGNISSFLKYINNDAFKKYSEKIKELNHKVHQNKVTRGGQGRALPSPDEPGPPTDGGLRPMEAKNKEGGLSEGGSVEEVQDSGSSLGVLCRSRSVSVMSGPDSIEELNNTDTTTETSTSTATQTSDDSAFCVKQDWLLADLIDEEKYMKIKTGKIYMFIPKDDFVEYALTKIQEKYPPYKG